MENDNLQQKNENVDSQVDDALLNASDVLTVKTRILQDITKILSMKAKKHRRKSLPLQNCIL